jgi:deoxyribose-phosphate aldolase
MKVSNPTLSKLLTLDKVADEVKIITTASSFENLELTSLFGKQLVESLYAVLDFTSLGATDNATSITNFCASGKGFSEAYSIPAVCVHPNWIAEAKKELASTNIKVASVAGGFPDAQIPTKLKLEEVRYVIGEGADEVDYVITRGTFLQGEYEAFFDEISAAKSICGQIPLKVILETGELSSLKNIWAAANLSLHAGADFLKTSTGSSKQGASGASFFAALILFEAVKSFYQDKGVMRGVKISGGVSDVPTAIRYYKMAEAYFGKNYLSASHFRIGSSGLANAIQREMLNL